jgi:hypothetical protein
MLKFEKRAAQGELMITRLDKAPKNIGEIELPVNGKLIVGYSETGHHHLVDGDCATLTRIDVFTAFLNVSKPTAIVHQREFDTHPPIALQPGMYIVRTGREFDPFEETIRASAD